MPPLRTAAAALLCVPLVLLTGCSDTDGQADAKASSSAPATSIASTTAVADDAQVVDALLAKALAKVDSGETAEAQRLFTSVLDLDAGNVYAHYNLGYLAQLVGDTRPALTHYNAALKTQSDFAPALYNLAILTEPADLAASVDLYRRVVESNGGDAGTYFRLGHALVHLGQSAEGEELIAQAIALDASLADTPAPTYG